MPVSQRYPLLLVRCVTLASVNSQRVFSLLSHVPSAAAAYMYMSLGFCLLTFFFIILHSLIKKMLNFLYDGFVALYEAILPQKPTLAHEHSLRQEQEIYERTTKSTYPNVILFRSSHFK